MEYREFYMNPYDQTQQSLDAGRGVEEAIAAYERPVRYSEFTANPSGPFSVGAIVRYICQGK
ncbi:MAG: hypothetical protein VYE68_10030 [Acidobacteriota bacterium]|nr:hypothetical protein [Acidobacteriota bacterium]